MHSFNVNELSQKQTKKLMVSSVIPRPILTVSTLNEDESINIGPFSYFNMVSYDPPIVMVSVQRVNEEMKDTTRNILRTNEAVGHIVTESNLEDVNQTSATLAYGDSELARTNFNPVDSKKVAVPGLDNSSVRYEMKLNHHHVITNHDGEQTADVLLLEVVQIYVSESVFENTYIYADRLKPVARLAGSLYSKLGEEFKLERPE